MNDSSDDDAPLNKSGGSRAKRAAIETRAKEPSDDDGDSCYSDDEETSKKKQKTSAKATKKKAAPKQKAARTPQAKAKSKVTKPAKTARKAAKASEPEEEVPTDARKYFKTGQKHITPPNGDGTRAFYESLYDENGSSLISLKFCIEHGVFNGTKLHEALPKYEMLRDLGAFKGRLGGLHPEFKGGLTEKHIKAAKKLQREKGVGTRKKI